MANQELGIQVTADLADAISQLQDLLQKILDIPSDKSANLGVEVSGDEELNTLKDNLEVISDKNINVDASLSGDAADRMQDLEETATTIDGKSIGLDAELTGGASEGLDDLEAQAENLDGKEIDIDVGTTGDDIDETDSSINTLSSDTDTATDSTSDFARGLGSLLAPLTGLKASSDSLDFSKSLEQTTIWYGLSGSAAADYTSKMQDVVDATHNASISATDVAAGFKELASLGVDQNSALTEMPELVSMATRNNMDLNTTIDKGTTILRAWGLSGDEANKTLSELNYTAQTFGTDAPAYISAFQRMSQSMSGFDIDPTQLMGITEAMKNGGASVNQLTRAFRSTTSMKEFKSNMDEAVSGTGDAKAAMDALGVSVVLNADGTVNYGQTMVAISDALGNVSNDTQRTQYATEIFGDSVGNVFGKIKGEPSEYAQEVQDSSAQTTSDLGQSASDHKDLLARMKVYWDDLIETIGTLPTVVQLGIGLLGVMFGGAVAGQMIQWMMHPIEQTKAFADAIKKLPSNIRDGVSKTGDLIKSIGNFFKTPETDMASFFDRMDKGLLEVEGPIQSTESRYVQFIDKIKTKTAELKDSNLSKILFGDEKGNVNTSLDDMLKTIQEKLPKFKESGGSIVDNVKVGIDEKLPTLDSEGESISNRIIAGLNSKLPDFKTEGQQIVASINEGIIDSKIEIPTAGTTGGKVTLPEGSTGSTGGTFKLPDGNEILPPESETNDGKTNLGWMGDSNGLGGIVDKLKTWTTIPKFNAASLGRGLLSVLGDAEMLPMVVGTTLAEMNPVKHNLTPEEQAEVDKRNKKSIQEENDRPSFQQQVGAIGNALFPKTSSDAIVKPYQTAIDKVKNIKMPSLSGLQSSIGSSLGGLGTYINNHMPKMPSINWGTIKNGLSGPVQWVEGEWNGFKQWITNHTPKIPKLTWGNLSQGFWDTVGWLESEYNGLKDWVTSHMPKIPTLSWPNLTSGALQIVKDIEDAVNRVLGAINKLPGVSTITGTSTSGASSWGSSIVGGIASGIDKGKAAVQSGLNTISSWFPHSPPKDGPLSTITAGNMESWTSSIMMAGVGGVSNALPYLNDVLQSASGTFNSVNSSISNGVPQSVANMPVNSVKLEDNEKTALEGQKVTIQIQGPVTVRNDSDIEKIGTQFTRGIQGQAINRGVVTVNMLR